MALTQVSTNGIKDATIATADIANDAVNGTKIADDSINSEHYVDGSIDTAHIADLQVTTAKIAADAITGAKIADDAVGAEHIEVLDAALQFGDDVKAQFGASNDLEIFHQSGNNFIKNTTAGQHLKIKDADGDDMAIFNQGGAVELYHNGTKKFETYSSGVKSTGHILPGANNTYNLGDNSNTWTGLTIGDHGEIRLGNSQDLKIWHDGSHAYIQNTTGNLYIQPKASENAIKLVPDGAVELYYNNVKKLTTYSAGVEIHGSEGSDCELYLYADEGDDDADNWKLRTLAASSTFELQNRASGSWETNITAVGNGAVELYYDNVLKLTTLSGGIQMANGSGNNSFSIYDSDKLTFGNAPDLEIYHNGTDNYIKNVNGVFKLLMGSEYALTATANGSVDLYHNDVKKLETTADGVQINGTTLEISSTACHIDFMESGVTDSHHRIRQNAGNLYIQKLSSDKSTTTDQFKIDGGTGSLSLYHDGTEKLRTDSSGVGCHGDCYPINNNSYDLGNSSSKWDDVYATNDTIQTSDKNEKNTIVETDLGLSFVNKLKPVSYKFNGKTRTHYGLIAQDIETTLSDISKPTTDFAGFIKEDIPDQLYVKEDEIPEGKKVGDLKTAAYTTYGLRYNEFISPLIKAVQELSAEVNTLKTKVAALEAA